MHSRYYDPEVGRFLSQDDLDYADPETINGLNLYAYSGNNPVMNFDPTGCFAISIFLISLGIGLAVGAGLGGYTAVQNGAELWSKDFWIGVGTGALIGGAVGAVAGLSFAGAGMGYLVGGLSSVGGKLVADAASSLIFGTNNFGTWEDYAVAFIAGGLMKGLKLGNGARFAVDVLARPMANQLTKMGTRGAEFSFEKYAYNVIIRAATFNIGFGKFSMPMFGSEFSVTFGKSILRGFLSGFGKKYLF